MVSEVAEMCWMARKVYQLKGDISMVVDKFKVRKLMEKAVG
jgi:hypothetical protein